MNGKLLAEVYGIVESVIPSRTYLTALQYMVLDKEEMVATNLDIVVKVKTLSSEIAPSKMIVKRDNLKSIIPTIKKTRDVVIGESTITVGDIEQHLDITDEYPDYNDLAGMGSEYRFLFSTSDIHLTDTLIDRMICMAKGIDPNDYRPALIGYIFDPEGHFIYTTNGCILFGTDYSSVSNKVYMGEDNLETFTMPDISKILKKVKNIKTIKVEDTPNTEDAGGWVRFTIYCDNYTVEINARKILGTMLASTIHKVIPVGRGDNTLILSSESIDKIVGLFGKGPKGVKFQKIDNEIVCTAINTSSSTVYKIQDKESNFDTVGFNANYLKSISDFYRCSMVEFNFKTVSDGTRANIFDNDDIAVVMPIRLPNSNN